MKLHRTNPLKSLNNLLDFDCPNPLLTGLSTAELLMGIGHWRSSSHNDHRMVLSEWRSFDGESKCIIVRKFLIETFY